MLGDSEEMQTCAIKASKDDLVRMRYEDKQGFADRAGDLCDKFLKERSVYNSQQFEEGHGFIFAFQNQTDMLDILVVRGSKLVFKASGMVFVSKGNKAVLKSGNEVVLTGNGKSVIIKK
jgi:hypothetical protein